MQSIRQLMRSNPAFAKQVNELSPLQSTWQTLLPPNLGQATQVAGVTHKRLTVYANNGAVAAKIKLLMPTLLAGLQRQGVEVTAIRIKVQVQSIPYRQNRAIRTVSNSAADTLVRFSETLEETPLAKTLARIASHTRHRHSE